MMEERQDDEFAEIDTTEDELDRMMATGEPVAVVTSWLVSPPRSEAIFAHSPPDTRGGVAVVAQFGTVGSWTQTINDAVGQMVGAS